ncbi:hypothetical protein CDAR_585731 [Caerostris darwini]|uniref:Uncharacterized protein n=1 Tax=Caerostris darwini TaxID=1538125 RepID=A0AAV4TJW2_9ARAC|nr:hypothetical protein CDAR_585731 [Caerostris darwini]
MAGEMFESWKKSCRDQLTHRLIFKMASVIIIVRGKRNDGRLIIGQQLLPLLAHGFLRGVIDDRGRRREILSLVEPAIVSVVS